MPDDDLTLDRHLSRLTELRREARTRVDLLRGRGSPAEVPVLRAWQAIATVADRALHPATGGELGPAVAAALARGDVRVDVNTTTAVLRDADQNGEPATFVVRARAVTGDPFAPVDATQALGNRLRVFGHQVVVRDAQVDRGGYWLSMVVTTDVAVAERRRNGDARTECPAP